MRNLMNNTLIDDEDTALTTLFSTGHRRITEDVLSIPGARVDTVVALEFL
jgi:hypothetical protein